MYVEGPTRTLKASAAIGVNLRVIGTAGKLALAGAGDREIGTMERPTNAADEDVAVRLRSAAGSREMVAAGAITQFAWVYGAASGKVTATANANPVGIALEAATANNDVIEVLVMDREGARNVEAHTANDTLTADETGSVHSTVGAAGAVTFSMPATTVGLEYFFRVGAAQELRIDPNGTETIALPSTGVQGAAGKYLTANADGETVHIVCDKAGEWSVYGFTGTWTAEV